MEHELNPSSFFQHLTIEEEGNLASHRNRKISLKSWHQMTVRQIQLMTQLWRNVLVNILNPWQDKRSYKRFEITLEDE